MDHLQGEIKKVIGGKPRTFKFGMNASRVLADKVNIDETSKNPFAFIPAIFWAGLKVRESVNDLPEDFSIDMVGDWVDTMSPEDAAEVYEIAEGSLGFIKKMMDIAEQRKARIKKAA